MVDSTMAPHADTPEMALESVPERNGSRFKTHLQSTPQNDVHDVICLGFGPAALAIAVALHDSTKQTGKQRPQLTTQPKVAFLERQEN